MSATKNESNLQKQKPSANTTNAKTQPTGSPNSVVPLKGTNGESKSLSTNVAEHLLHLMQEVTKENVSPQTVNAACNCATQMINLMKLNMKLRDL